MDKGNASSDDGDHVALHEQQTELANSTTALESSDCDIEHSRSRKTSSSSRRHKDKTDKDKDKTDKDKDKTDKDKADKDRRMKRKRSTSKLERLGGSSSSIPLIVEESLESSSNDVTDTSQLTDSHTARKRSKDSSATGSASSSSSSSSSSNKTDRRRSKHSKLSSSLSTGSTLDAAIGVDDAAHSKSSGALTSMVSPRGHLSSRRVVDAPVTPRTIDLSSSPTSGSTLLSASNVIGVAERQYRKQKPRPLSFVFQGALLVAIADFVGEGDDELTFKKGDVIMFVERDDNNWVRGECNDKVGWFPGTHVQPLPGVKTNPLNESDSSASIKYDSLSLSLSLSLSVFACLSTCETTGVVTHTALGGLTDILFLCLLSRTQQVDNSPMSILEKKNETKNKLSKFLALRPTQRDIKEHNPTLLAGGMIQHVGLVQ
jgi:hypothetical protein